MLSCHELVHMLSLVRRYKQPLGHLNDSRVDLGYLFAFC